MIFDALFLIIEKKLSVLEYYRLHITLRTLRADVAADASTLWVPCGAASDAMAAVLHPMEVRTFLVDFTLALGVVYAA